ncbi:transcriptional regulator, Sir2 family domain containing protein [Babesia divergens]|uniref:Transcriptional regulator, Sir2 family domain containing protein n=1 Tax=Babesia divergens TaxID=32595 RepID=A0AAD9GKL0_BABDI|nr:transcriptional regulator, Sir2 family domain containing protein [Babesia divergens]
MVSSALSYATQLKRNDNKGPCGTVQLFDTPAEVARKFQKLYALLCYSKRAVVHTGAGVSTAAGIPDFRGPSGVWTVMSLQDAAKKRRKMTDGDCTVKSANDMCVEYGRCKMAAVEFSQAMPSVTHLAVLTLLRAGHISSVITQNIDGLHAISGMRHSECAEVHGNVLVERCISCARRFLRPYVSPTISFKPTGNHCGTFPPSGILTDVVLDWFDSYEDHFEKRAVSYSQEADFHLTLGSSLHVEPACHYASSEHYRQEEAPLVIVNYQKTRLDAEADVVIHCDVNLICKRLLNRFRLPIPVFIRHFYMVGLHYNQRSTNKVLLRLPCVTNLMVSDRYTSQGKVLHRCLNVTHGLHEFSFDRDFEVVLKLWFDAEMVIKVVYLPECPLTGLVWRLSLAATNGPVTHRKHTQITHKFEKFVGNGPISVTSVQLSYNAALIPKEEACRIIALVSSRSEDLPHFKAKPLPSSITRLFTCFNWLWKSVGTPFDHLVEIKPDEGDSDTFGRLDNFETLPEVMRVCLRIAFHHKLGSISKGQFCVDTDALNSLRQKPHCLDPYFEPGSLSLICADAFEFGEMVDRASADLRICLPRRIRPIAPCRTTSMNPLDELFITVLRGSIYQIMAKNVRSSHVFRLVNLFKTDFPTWFIVYLADLFECR